MTSRSRHAGPTITALRAYAAEISDAEVAFALRRLGGLSAAEASVVRALAHRIVGRLLHRPLTALESDANDDNVAHVLGRLFQVDPEAKQRAPVGGTPRDARDTHPPRARRAGCLPAPTPRESP